MGCFIDAIRGKKVIPIVKDSMYWEENRKGFYSVKSLLGVLDSSSAALFLHKHHLEPLCSSKSGIFSLEKLCGGSF